LRALHLELFTKPSLSTFYEVNKIEDQGIEQKTTVGHKSQELKEKNP